MSASNIKGLPHEKTPEAILNAPPNEVSYEHVLTHIGFGKAQWMLLISSGLMTLTSMSAQYSIGIISIASQCEFRMSQMEKGIMMSACVAGIFLSTYVWGYLSDSFGRRAVLLSGAFATSALQFVLMFVTNIWLFNCINLAIGISLGGVSAALYTNLSEFNTAKNRPVVINYSTMFVSIAAIYVPVVSWLLLSLDWSFEFHEAFVFRPWRLIILLTLLPGFVGALLLLPCPESPKLLLAQRRMEEAVLAVEWICHFNTRKSVSSVIGMRDYTLQPEGDEHEDLLAKNSGCSVLVNIWRATLPLFHKPHRNYFILSLVVISGMFFSYSGMQMWYPEIVNRSSDNSTDRSLTVCQILDSSFNKQSVSNTTAANGNKVCDESISTETYVQNIIVGAAFLLGFAIQGTLLKPLGRKNVLIGALGFSTLSGILLHFVPNATVVLVLFCLYILLPGLAISVMLEVVVELMPTHLRGKAISICLTLGRFGIMLSAYLIGIMLEPLCNTTFAMFTATMLVCAFLVHLLPI